MLRSLLLAAAFAAAPTRSASASPGVRTLLFFGDSITAGYGVDPSSAFPALVEGMVRESGLPWKVATAGVSGDTTAGGLARIEWVLRARPDLVFVELGANDGLRGTDPDETRKNLEAIVKRLKKAGARVVLGGMRLPPNYGPDFTRRFEAVFPAVARRRKVPLMPFVLEGVGGRPELNQVDGLHPNEEGHRVVARGVFEFLKPHLERAPAERKSR